MRTYTAVRKSQKREKNVSGVKTPKIKTSRDIPVYSIPLDVETAFVEGSESIASELVYIIPTEAVDD